MTRYRARIRFADIAEPMMPRPIIPMNLLSNFVLCTLHSLRGQLPAPRFLRKGQEEQTEQEDGRRHGDGNTEAAVRLDGGADEKHHGDADESADRTDERDGAGAAAG